MAGTLWLVVRTRARAEKQVAAYCAKLGWPHYLPQRRSVRRYGPRAVTFYLPLFPGYVFAQLTADQRPALEQSRHVATLLLPAPPAEAGLIRELNDVLLLETLSQQETLVVRPELVVGQVVEIQQGPLAGLRGIIQRRKHEARLSVNVEMIGQSVSVEIDAGEVTLYS